MPDFIKIPDKPKLYQAADTVNIKAVVGGINTDYFAPSVNISFKMGSGKEQYFFNICDDVDQVKTVGKSEDWQGNKLKIKDGDVESTFELLDTSLKIERVFYTKPTYAPKYKLSFSQGVSFHYQDVLTPADLAEGCIRHDNVVGSYAVYCDKSGHHKDKSGNTIVNYGCGKIGHLYAPYWTDSSGKKVKGVQEINGNILIFALPDQAWLDLAVLPITLDPDVGYTTIGSSLGTFNPGHMLASGPSQAGDTFNASEITIYTDAGDSEAGEATFGIYDDSAGVPIDLVEQTNGVTVTAASWGTYDLKTNPSITSGNSYWIGVNCSVKRWYRWDDVGGKTAKWHESVAYSSGNLSDPFGSIDGTVDRYYSWYFSGESGSTLLPIKLNEILAEDIEKVNGSTFSNFESINGV